VARYSKKTGLIKIKVLVEEFSFLAKLIAKKDPTPEEIKEAFNWLDKIYNEEYTSYRRILHSQSQEVWDQYEKMGMTDLVEVRVLRKAKSQLRAVLKKKPAYFRSRRA